MIGEEQCSTGKDPCVPAVIPEQLLGYEQVAKRIANIRFGRWDFSGLLQKKEKERSYDAKRRVKNIY